MSLNQTMYSTYAPAPLVLASIIGAFTLIMSLAWNNLVQTTINDYVDEGNTIWAQLIYAIVVTIISILAIVVIVGVFQRVYVYT